MPTETTITEWFIRTPFKDIPCRTEKLAFSRAMTFQTAVVKRVYTKSDTPSSRKKLVGEYVFVYHLQNFLFHTCLYPYSSIGTMEYLYNKIN
jgi:hypothetical protein